MDDAGMIKYYYSFQNFHCAANKMVRNVLQYIRNFPFSQSVCYMQKGVQQETKSSAHLPLCAQTRGNMSDSLDLHLERHCSM